jgi:hypothetical protein
MLKQLPTMAITSTGTDYQSYYAAIHSHQENFDVVIQGVGGSSF